MSRVPDALRREARERLWRWADELGWVHLPAGEKSRWYGTWTESPDVGQRLAPFLDPLKIRVYIKDTLLKDYQRSRLAMSRGPLLNLGLSEELHAPIVFEKPYGLVASAGRVVAWGRASDWKTILLAVHERAYRTGLVPFGAALLQSGARYQTDADRAVVEEAARLLRIQRLAWMD